jgi:DNA-binding response OmpR family regulator
MKVLLADDDEFMRLLAEEVLRQGGHEVVAVGDGEQAWAAYEHDQPPLVLLDWQMPGLDGVEVCRRIREADPDRQTFVLVITARDASDALATVLDAGADDYLSKPVAPEGLQARLAIAERRIAQLAAQREAEAKLAQARWLAGIGETTLALQHEINNPLAALLGNASLLEAGLCEGEEERRQCVAAIVEQAKRIGAVVKRLQALRDPQSVEYLRGGRMLDLSKPTEQ